MEYIRPDVEIILYEYDKIINNFTNSKDLDSQIKCIRDHNNIFRDFQTMATIANIKYTIDTSNKLFETENKFIKENSPVIEDKVQILYNKILNSKYINEIANVFGDMFITKLKLSSKTFSNKIIHLLKLENSLKLDYQKLIASAKINFDNKILNLPQLSPYKSNINRNIRKQAYIAEGTFLESIKPQLDDIFNNLVKIRTEIGTILNYDNFIPIAYYRMDRDCYNSDHVKNYRDNVLNIIVPEVLKIKQNQKQRLGLDQLKFYDDTLAFKDGNPMPFGSYQDTINAAKQMYSKMGKITNHFFNFMIDNNLFDLISKPNKASGGYCTFIPKYKTPFIFSNFNGTSADVDVLTHEAGHALASFIARDHELLETISPSLETCEVHSMSMEYLSWPWLDLFYKDSTEKAKIFQLESSLAFIPYGCMIDEFQHDIYLNPTMTSEQRDNLWMELESKYRPYNKFEDIPFYSKGCGWQRQLHVYTSPFYYIDYCLAETIALQFWALSNKDYEQTFNKYIDFVKIGGKDNFINSIKKCDLKNPFEPDTLKYIIKSVNEYFN